MILLLCISCANEDNVSNNSYQYSRKCWDRCWQNIIKVFFVSNDCVLPVFFYFKESLFKKTAPTVVYHETPVQYSFPLGVHCRRNSSASCLTIQHRKLLLFYLFFLKKHFIDLILFYAEVYTNFIFMIIQVSH